MKKLELPKPQEKERVTLDVESTLLARAKSATKKKKIKFREAVEFGLRKFIEECEK